MSNCWPSAPSALSSGCDDLSFEEGDDAHKALKNRAGRWSGAPRRQCADLRHLQPPPPSDARAHAGQSWTAATSMAKFPGEAVEEKSLLSERFGPWLSFYPFDQDTYLAAVAVAGASPAETHPARRTRRALVGAHPWHRVQRPVALAVCSRLGRAHLGRAQGGLNDTQNMTSTQLVEVVAGVLVRPTAGFALLASAPGGQGTPAIGNSPAARSSPVKRRMPRWCASCKKSWLSPSPPPRPGWCSSLSTHAHVRLRFIGSAPGRRAAGKKASS